MKILLVGEYSRLHNSLKEGLVFHGHEVVIAASGDGFKNYPVDIKLEPSFFKSSFGNLIRQATYYLTKYDLASWEILRKFNALKPKLKGFDVVQLINESSFLATPKVEKIIISYLKENNNKLFLLSCGTDYTSVSYAMHKKSKYSIFTPLFDNPELKKKYTSSLKYITPEFEKLHQFIMGKVDGIIASDTDYHIPLIGHPKYLGMIPNPVNTKKLQFEMLTVSDKINIFLGINSTNSIKKGIALFKTAVEQLQKKYPEKVNITITENLPYSSYINSYNNAHIILDQVYSYDQGYNALEAMAKGKVVFTGAEQEWLEHYNLKENTVAINALPNAKDIADKLEWLIQNPEKIVEISKNARAFVEREHDYKSIASKYLDLWKLN